MAKPREPFSTFTHLEDPFTTLTLWLLPVPFNFTTTSFFFYWPTTSLTFSVAEQLSTTQLVWLLRFEKGPSRNGMGWRFVQHELRALKATIFRGSWSELEDRCATKEHDSVLNCVGLMVDRGQDSEGEKLLVIPVLVLLIASNGPTRCPNARASA